MVASGVKINLTPVSIVPGTHDYLHFEHLPFFTIGNLREEIIAEAIMQPLCESTDTHTILFKHEQVLWKHTTLFGKREIRSSGNRSITVYNANHCKLWINPQTMWLVLLAPVQYDRLSARDLRQCYDNTTNVKYIDRIIRVHMNTYTLTLISPIDMQQFDMTVTQMNALKNAMTITQQEYSKPKISISKEGYSEHNKSQNTWSLSSLQVIQANQRQLLETIFNTSPDLLSPALYTLIERYYRNGWIDASVDLQNTMSFLFCITPSTDKSLIHYRITLSTMLLQQIDLIPMSKRRLHQASFDDDVYRVSCDLGISYLYNNRTHVMFVPTDEITRGLRVTVEPSRGTTIDPQLAKNLIPLLLNASRGLKYTAMIYSAPLVTSKLIRYETKIMNGRINITDTTRITNIHNYSYDDTLEISLIQTATNSNIQTIDMTNTIIPMIMSTVPLPLYDRIIIDNLSYSRDTFNYMISNRNIMIPVISVLTQELVLNGGLFPNIALYMISLMKYYTFMNINNPLLNVPTSFSYMNYICQPDLSKREFHNMKNNLLLRLYTRYLVFCKRYANMFFAVPNCYMDVSIIFKK